MCNVLGSSPWRCLQISLPVLSLIFVVCCCLQDQRKEFLMLFMAIASHKLISGLALSSRFLKDGATTRQVRSTATHYSTC